MKFKKKEVPDKVDFFCKMRRDIREKLRELSKEEDVPMIAILEQMISCEWRSMRDDREGA